MRLLVVAVALAAATVAPAQAAHTACGAAAARAAISATKVRVQTLGDSATRVDPKSVDQVICFDFTRDGRTDLAVSIASGGTAGDIGYVVFRDTPAGWRVVLEGGGYKLGLARAGGDLVETQPIYKQNDANCCPTGGFDHRRLHWNRTKFVLARAWHTRTFRP
ncbi:MAG TPA: hypothetical protein VLK53_10425 [Gaiellaceae bacterium]|nr:hypothetical protein [Gaiellaceae bacterium]